MKGAVEHDDLRLVDPPPVRALARELDGTLVGLEARVAQKDLPAQARLRQPLGQPHPRLRVVEVGDAAEAPGLPGDRLDDPRVAMARVVDRQPGEEVQVLAPLGVPQPDAFAAHELHWRARVRRHRVALLEGDELRDVHHVTIVPIPASVKSSSRSEWGVDPSMMCAEETPPRIASMQAASFGRIPPLTPSSAAVTSSTDARETRDAGSSGSTSQPAMSVRKIALCAASAAATLPAAVSALTL